MEEMLKNFSNSVAGWGGAIAAGIVGIAVYLPKFLNGMKSDKVDGNVLDRLLSHERRMNEMDKQIHAQQIKLTRLQVLVIKLEGLISTAGIQIHDSLKNEISELIDKGGKE